MKRFLIFSCLLSFLSVSGAQSAGRIPRRIDAATDAAAAEVILQENAIFFGILTGIGVTLSISDPMFGFEVNDINLNLITRSLLDATGKQLVVFRVGGVVRSNGNVEMNLLDASAAPIGKFFYGYRSGDLLFFDSEERLVIRGIIDYAGRFSLSDLRLPVDQQQFVSGRFTWYYGYPGFNYTWNDRQGTVIAQGLILFWPHSSFPSGIDRIRTHWYSQGGVFDGNSQTYVDAEYDLRKEATGALNSNIFDRRPAAAAFFRHPYDLLPSPPSLAWIPRLADDTSLCIFNNSSQEAQVTLTARQYDGSLLRGEGIVNPITYVFPPGLQTTAFPRDYLRGFSEKDQRAVLPFGALPVWLEIAGNQPYVNTTYYDNGLRDLDGTTAALKARGELLLDGFRLSSEQTPEITLLNLSHSAANARLTAYNANGEVLSRADRFYIPARGFRNFVLGTFPEIFPGLDVGRVATLRIENISNGTGLAASCIKRSPAGTLESLRDRGAEERSDVLWVPFFVSGSDTSGRWSCRITLTEWGEQENLLHIQIYSLLGEQLGSSDRLLKARGSWDFEIKDLVEIGQGSFMRGYLQISGARGILGSVSFRYESATGSSAASIPLAPYPTNVLVFPQIAQGSSKTTRYYTGLVILNPYEVETRVTVVAVDSEGNTTGQAEVAVSPQTSSLRLLDQLFGSQFQQFGGYLRLKSTRPILSQALFGDSNGAILAAIPSVF